MQRGLTLFELIVVVALVGILAAATLPSVRRLADRLAVEHAAGSLTAAHWTARGAAQARGARVALRISEDSISIWRLGTASRDRIAAFPGPARYDVQLRASREEVMFGPSGIGWGTANTTLRLRRGGAEATLVISSLGRLRRLPP